MNKPAPTRIQSVQGLRAIAVIAVLLFHTKISFIAGGFVGVDVFFVISGFVISLLLRKQIESQRFSFAEFYQRRAWRLMPALAVTLLFSALLFGFLMPASANPTLLYALVSAVFGISNFYFNNTLDYFDSGITNPVLHTWSLGVEEQFYLAYPLLLWFLYRHFSIEKPRVIRNVVMGLVVIGFALAAYQTQHFQSSAFYLPWFRAWEFLAGASIAFINLKNVPQHITKTSSWLGLLILTPVILFYHEHYTFPGIGALLPVLGTMLLLLGSQSQNSINAILSSKPLRLIGDISYSLYLVHWPVICFVGIFVSLENPITQIFNVILSLILGYLSWRFIEEKFRHGIKPFANIRQAITPIALMFTSASIVLLSTFATNTFWNQFPEAKLHFAEKDKYKSLFRESQCFMVTGKIDQYDNQACLQLSQNKDNVIVMGDSLAANLVLMMQKRWPQQNIMQATALDYIPGNPIKWSPIAKDLDAIVQRFYNKNNANIQTFVLYALWQQDDLDPLKKHIQKLKSQGHKVIVLGPSPQLYIGAPIILAHSEIFDINISQYMFKKSRESMDKNFKAALGEADQYISSYDILCPKKICGLHIQDKSLFFDKVHLTKNGAEYLVGQL